MMNPFNETDTPSIPTQPRAMRFAQFARPLNTSDEEVARRWKENPAAVSAADSKCGLRILKVLRINVLIEGRELPSGYAVGKDRPSDR